MKLKYHQLLSSFAFNFNLRPYDATAEKEKEVEAGSEDVTDFRMVLADGMDEFVLIEGEAVTSFKQGRAEYCPSRQPTHFKPSLLELNGIL